MKSLLSHLNRRHNIGDNLKNKYEARVGDLVSTSQYDAWQYKVVLVTDEHVYTIAKSFPTPYRFFDTAFNGCYLTGVGAAITELEQEQLEEYLAIVT